MRSSATILGFVAAVSADFQVYVGNTNDPVGGGTGDQAYFIPMGEQVTCDNLGAPVIMRLDTSTLGGVACDGCELDKPSNDWDVTRFEMTDREEDGGGLTTSLYGSITAYGEGNGLYGVNVPNPERRIGRCERITGEDLHCSSGITAQFAGPLLNCFSETEPLDLI